MRELVKKFWKDEEGATAVEYGVLVALIIVVVMVAIGPLGTKLQTLFSKVDEKIVPPT